MSIESLWYGLKPSFWQQLSTILILMVVLLPAAIGDYQRQKVPNWLSMSGWVVAPVIAWLCTGGDGMVDSLLGLGLMVALLFPLWMVHWFGAADVKLMGTVGAFVGVADSLTVLLGVFLVGMLMALVIVLYRGQFLLVMKGFVFNLRMKAASDSTTNEEVDRREQIMLPYAIPIAFGTMFSILYLQLY